MRNTGLHLIGAGHVVPNPAWGMRPHAHPHHELIAVVGGGMRVRMRGGWLAAEPGDVLLYPARVMHEESTDSARPVETYFVGFRGPAFADAVPLLVRNASGRIAQMIRWLYEDRLSSDPMARREETALLAAIVADYGRTDAGLAQGWVAVVRAHIRAHLREPLTLDGLARVAGLSKFHFVRRYRALSGRTPMQEVSVLRAEHARNLILTTDLPLKQIAAASGVGSEYTLSRLSRRVFGVPPGRFRHARGR